ncbi:hypothetical protein K3G39_04225 [Pontibacter sp. HSC-14F20]|uniref:hypothetical protein n=1 Tax=Pontibacter sp. HSC-14F20 TaxID=2864136 RepID=UPI001C72D2E2|nr:hypothetical protein [Pontibacter sp. HSC-14F20]MBX0332437.1 hypothetical protein [Pontibacter sp. HSC-14F20]
MKTNYVLYLVAMLLLACNEQPVQELATASTSEAAPSTETTAELTDEQMEAMRQKCEAYYASLNVHDSVRVAYLDRILTEHPSKLTTKNRRFLTQLKQDFITSTPKQPRLTIEQVLFPVFKIPNQPLGIIGQPVPDMDRPNEFTDVSAEAALLQKWVGPDRANSAGTPLVHYPELLESVYPSGKPQVYLYTTNTARTSQIKELGYYQSECSEYYHYTFDEQVLQSGDEVLFASRLPLDLTYENNPAFDSWYRSNLIPECADCPSSHDKAITVAKLTGTDDLYFMYADAFPDNQELHTPLRALIAKGENGKWLYLWYSDIDNFGCSCL